MKSDYKKEWLPHLKDSISSDAGIPGVSLYSIALEGWRRNLKLKFYAETEGRRRLKYILSNKDKIFYFDDSSGNLNTDEAIKICSDKGVTEEYLKQANIPVPRGKVFNEHHSISEMKEFARSINYPLVVKPVDGLGGKGVMVDINNEKELINAIRYVQNKLSFNKIIIQEFIKGNEVRIYVLNDEVIAAAKRIPANIIGDGLNTIQNLIDKKNKSRKKVPNLQYRPIRVDEELIKIVKEQGYTLKSVLPKGEKLYLRKISNVSIGGEPVDYTDQLTDEQRKIAIEATKAIPGLKQCGVDMMVDEVKGTGVIIELNSSPGIGSHLFPVEGKARDIPKAIIDYYFPETKQYNSKLYFNLGKIGDGLYSGTLAEVEIPMHHNKKMFAKKYTIITELQILDIYEYLKEHILDAKLNGFIREIEKDTFDIVVSHVNEDKINEFEELLADVKCNIQIKSIKSSNWNKPIKIGFDVIDGFNTMSIFELENSYKHLYREVRVIEKEVQRLSKKIELTKNSSSWKITKPIRIINNLIKK